MIYAHVNALMLGSSRFGTKTAVHVHVSDIPNEASLPLRSTSELQTQIDSSDGLLSLHPFLTCSSSHDAPNHQVL
ncbi:hypothetical protein A0H81_12116 [Grifola frondosa]|uniref:Uncharacterized protein n=1 Tax=Grifola frondosa TaxID=5627 RepID=A0A1C7LT67_GRIFR|nr:hypothetical protein A0H81_12116 [Grifola frondosa]